MITFTTLELLWGRRVFTAIYNYTFIPYETGAVICDIQVYIHSLRDGDRIEDYILWYLSKLTSAM